ncbi:transposase [Exilibacterium tricleocarpae]|uniref:Transposase n=1 Tax=Exilibacterium tricleocarpae TaxID=2591008 RepID=A0A545T0D4_9GAMM|nr:transposase [Exilibacterium tricleocarpae]TQV70683.1 transposase [Exilibacterium tricleocarpae]
MPKPRKQIISLDITPYYHCTSRCVRRAFLCGQDSHTGQSYEHRRGWIEERLLLLGQVFAIDICAYAIMSNHYHLVLHVDTAAASQWSNREVCERWHQLYRGTLLTRKYLDKEPLSDLEMEAVEHRLGLWRQRLSNISWFMRTLNEAIARAANKEDNCTGRFWESRFTAQALLDEKALTACMVYVDLNPIRAKTATTPETSKHTSVKLRIDAVKTGQQSTQPSTLLPFGGNFREPKSKGLPYQLADYLALVDWTGHSIRADKKGFISDTFPPILARLDIAPTHWLYLATRFESRLKGLVGSIYALKKATDQLGYQRTPGVRACQLLFS